MSYNKLKSLVANVEAIKTALQIHIQGRQATPEEKETLSQYSGFGGIKEVLNIGTDKPVSGDMEEPIRRLQELIDTYPYFTEAMKASVLTAFYTPKFLIDVVAKQIHATFKDNELQMRSFLEPSAGIGGFLPVAMSDTCGYAIEKDPVSGLILSLLNDNTVTRTAGFETIDEQGFEHTKFDVIASNIPFGNFRVFDAELWKKGGIYEQATKTIHNYFFVKALELLNEGGLLAFVTSRGVADTPSNKFVREYLVNHADLISAIRMPDTLFMYTSGIEVGSDLLIFQKHTHKAALSQREQLFLQVGREKADTTGAMTEYANKLFTLPKTTLATGSRIAMNQYGKYVRKYQWQGDENAMSQYLAALLKLDFGRYFRKSLFTSEGQDGIHTQMSLFGSVAVKQPPKGRRAYTDEPEAWMKEGAMVLFEGQVGIIRYRKSELYQETATDFVPVDEGKVNTERANDYFSIRKAYFELAIKEQEEQTEQPHLRERLNACYDAFVAKWTDGVGVLYTKTGEYSAVLKIENPVQKYSADIDSYYDFTHLFTALAQTLGEGYAIHKQDIFVRKQFASEPADGQEFLSASYFRYFKGRPYTDSLCYLTITQEAKKSRLFSFDNKKWRDFLVKIRKVHDQLHDSGVQARFLNKAEASEYVDRYFAMNFKDRTVSMTNFKADDETVSMGDKRCKVYSLVDVDCAALPSMIRPYTNIEVNNTEMPVDLASVVDNIPDAETVVYNQVIFLPNQKRELAMLDKKKNRHASIPNPNNQMAVEDIKRVQEVIARESKQLVYTHFNMVVAVSAGADLQKCTNHLENAFGRMGIHISKRAYNQLELFVGSFPGNCYTLNEEYDRFLTLSDAAMCLMYKERVLHSEETPLKIYYTDRQGVPVAIDITGKEGKNKLTDNSNFFCLGPSGSGKSFHINSVVRQLHEQGTDVVMVDTGNSYEGLCEYLGGKYISYTEERPITMNPFRINREEYNIEKIDFLKNLILMIWKGSDSQIPEIEFRIVEQIIIDYYDAYFNGFTRYTDEQREVLLKNLFAAASRKNPNKPPREVDEMVRKQIEVLEARRAALKVSELNFNSFFDYSFDRLEQICTENDITTISYSTYSTMLQPFYKGGAYEKILNENVDSALFDETFIVFEVDAIKENKKLFPIVTLIIMDVFLQKMRIKKTRKVLVIEEAWKAIASPLMAEYIKFMYKTARKFWASVGVVTQEIQDIIGSEIVKEAIINNSDVVMLLDQSKFKERFDEIRKILGLTEVDCKKIFTINRLENKDGRSFFREVFIRRGTTSGVYGVEEPHECYMTYTTERAEKEALKLYKKELRCSHQEAIEAYCRDWDASGIGKALPFAQKVNETGRVLNLRPVHESK